MQTNTPQLSDVGAEISSNATVKNIQPTGGFRKCLSCGKIGFRKKDQADSEMICLSCYRKEGICHRCRSVKSPQDKYCKKCHYACVAKWRKDNYEYFYESVAKRNEEIKLEVLLHYSEGGLIQCACCNEKNIEFITIDHTAGDESAHRKKIGAYGTQFYKWIKRNNFPEGYRPLCFNCNYALGFFGRCPHGMAAEYPKRKKRIGYSFKLKREG